MNVISPQKKKGGLFFIRLLGLPELFKPPMERVTSPFLYAVEELKRRQEDRDLRRKVEEYLEGNVPKHFTKDPILYLARHVATPNFETLRFLHLVESSEIPTVIGQDLKDKFVPQNQLKRALGKISISEGISQKNGNFYERFVNKTIVDFNTASGKSFHEIETHWGEPLADFHTELFREMCKQSVSIVDDSVWIDMNHRGDLLEHYKRFLALFLTHGILFEDLASEDDEERQFMRQVILPAFHFVHERFGYRPLIAQLTPTSVESPQFWLSYPKELKDILKEKFGA